MKGNKDVNKDAWKRATKQQRRKESHMERKIDVNREGYTRMKVKKEEKIREWREPNKQSTTGTTRHDDIVGPTGPTQYRIRRLV